MKNISDEALDKMLTEYCEADWTQPFAAHPQEKRGKIIPLSRFNRTAAAAASLVLVSVLSITVYFLLGNKINTPVAVAPSSQSATTPPAHSGESGGDSPLPNGESDPTEAPSPIRRLIGSLSINPTEAASGTRQRELQPSRYESSSRNPRTRNNSGTSADNNSADNNRNTQPTAASNQSNAKQPVKATEKPGESGGDSSTPRPTEGSVVSSTEQAQEPTSPTEPTDPPWSGDPLPTDNEYGDPDDPWNNDPPPSPGDQRPPASLYGTISLADTMCWGSAYVYAWDEYGDSLLGEWPGTPVTQTYVNDFGQTVFVADIPYGAAGMIFSNNMGMQTADIVDFSSDYYWMNGEINMYGHYVVTGNNE